MKRKPRIVKAKVRSASLAEVEQFYELRCKHYIAEVHGRAVAMGTVVRTNGRLWGWFDRKDGLTKKQGLAVIWALVKGLRSIGEPVYVTANEGVHPRANSLLSTLGFRPTGEVVNGFKIWVYDHG